MGKTISRPTLSIYFALFLASGESGATGTAAKEIALGLLSAMGIFR
jgi:hypothetical protein